PSPRDARTAVALGVPRDEPADLCMGAGRTAGRVVLLAGLLTFACGCGRAVAVLPAVLVVEALDRARWQPVPVPRAPPFALRARLRSRGRCRRALRDRGAWRTRPLPDGEVGAVPVVRTEGGVGPGGASAVDASARPGRLSPAGHDYPAGPAAAGRKPRRALLGRSGHKDRPTEAPPPLSLLTNAV